MAQSTVMYPVRRTVLLLLGSFLFSIHHCCLAASSPNIVFILADDLGWADLGCYGSKFHQTPNIDKLAAQGMRFTDAYAAAPICSPTRASILTGKYPARLHLTDWLPGRKDMPSQKLLRPTIHQQLALEETTLPEFLKPIGYTSGSFGKWHLGGEDFAPEKQGFDFSIGGAQGGTPPTFFFPYRTPRAPDYRVKGLENGDPGEYVTDRLTTEAEKFVEANKAKPFFLYFPHFAVHIPLSAKTNLIEKYKRLPPTTQSNSIYAAMLESLDQSVGRIMQKLDETKLAENTIVVFASDNGGLSVFEGPDTPATSNLPLRAGKGYLYEGGIRVPWIVRWQGVVQAGSTCRTPVSTIDFVPTFLQIIGIKRDTNQIIDGLSILPLLKQSGSFTRSNLFWHYPHYSNQGGKPSGAIRSGDLKLVEFYEDGAQELYNLKDDPGETNNLVKDLPKVAFQLQARLDAWRRSTQAQMPLPNPDYNPNANPGARVVKQNADGVIVLHSRDAFTHGSTIRYEPQPNKNTIGYWTRLQDFVTWDFIVDTPGTYEIEILQGCGKGSGGSEVEFSVGNQFINVTVQDTGGFQNFVARKIGNFKFDKPGLHTLVVKPKTKPGVAVMDLRSVTLMLKP
jgi:arylsulfatase A